MSAMTSVTRSKICLFAIAATLAACGGKPAAPPADATANAVTSLQSVVLKPGTGAAVANGQIAVVQYTGWLYEASASDNKGKQFDSSYTARQAFKFPLGSGSVIKGWDQGVVGMKVGESRRLVIPAELAYGDNGAGGVIPPGATFVYS
jgi:FKBP-type peptidyl-prolyl cis-trans isomerase FkpA